MRRIPQDIFVLEHLEAEQFSYTWDGVVSPRSHALRRQRSELSASPLRVMTDMLHQHFQDVVWLVSLATLNPLFTLHDLADASVS